MDKPMFSTPHNLANVPAWQLEEEQVTRAIRRTERHIRHMLEAAITLGRKNEARHLELDRQRARRAKQGAGL